MVVLNEKYQISPTIVFLCIPKIHPSWFVYETHVTTFYRWQTRLINTSAGCVRNCKINLSRNCDMKRACSKKNIQSHKPFLHDHHTIWSNLQFDQTSSMKNYCALT
ncbi:hypothetical protein RF11_02215 [Thelohanellus kitauei]|uniref:Uncharacterized protein n=1 Tax=Thelohanellus kitauei TaxID=669202 RepID=A0A0C2MP24_THEKT|nr:hypothetical protein RF11_02215 [Thelohanellus kitauei]